MEKYYINYLKRNSKIPVTEQGIIWTSREEMVRIMMHPVPGRKKMCPGYLTEGSQHHCSASTVLWPHATKAYTLLHSLSLNERIFHSWLLLLPSFNRKMENYSLPASWSQLVMLHSHMMEALSLNLFRPSHLLVHFSQFFPKLNQGN